MQSLTEAVHGPANAPEGWRAPEVGLLQDALDEAAYADLVELLQKATGGLDPSRKWEGLMAAVEDTLGSTRTCWSIYQDGLARLEELQEAEVVLAEVVKEAESVAALGPPDALLTRKLQQALVVAHAVELGGPMKKRALALLGP